MIRARAVLFAASLLAANSSAFVIDGAPGGVIAFTDGQRGIKLGMNLEPRDGMNPEERAASENSVSCLPYNDTTWESNPADRRHVRFVDRHNMDVLLDICLTSRDVRGDGWKSTRRPKRFILPGTKWCGLGDIATDYNDLGSDEQTDRCCRTHDHCPDHISPFQTKNGITNLSILYRFNCACEERFYSCLKQVTGENAASIIGRFYFNLLEPTCFRIDHPLKCQKKGWWFTCDKKVLDKSQPKVWGFYKFGKSF